MFHRVGQTALDDAVAKFEDGLLDTLCVLFLSFVPEDDFSSIITDTSELPEILRTFRHYTAINLSNFLSANLAGDL